MKQAFLILGIALMGLTTTSCKKKGCIDANAANYDESAEKDDESCTYNAVGVLYYDQDTYLASLLGIDNFEFFADGNSLGTTPGDNAWTGGTPPDCSSSMFAFSVDIGGLKKKLINFEMQDASDGTVLFTTSANLDGGVCTPVEFQ